jgi:hypothetical protein
VGVPIAAATAFVALFLMDLVVVFILLRTQLIVPVILNVIIVMAIGRPVRLFPDVLLGLSSRPSTTLATTGLGHKRGCRSWNPRTRVITRQRRLHSTIRSVATMHCCLLIAKTFLVVVIVVGHLLMVRVTIVRMDGRRKVMLPGVSAGEAVAITGQVVIVVVIVILIPRGGAPRFLELDTTRSARSLGLLIRTGSGSTLGRDLLFDWFGLLGRLWLPGCSLDLLHDPVQGIGIDEVSPIAVPEPVPGTVLTHTDSTCRADMEGARSPGVAPVALLNPTVLRLPRAVGADGVLGERLE